MLPDGRLLAGPSCYCAFAIDLATGMIERFGPAEAQNFGHLHPTCEGAPAPFVGLHFSELVFVDQEGREVERRASGYTKKYSVIDRFALSPNRRWLALAPIDGLVRLHDLVSAKKYNLKGIEGVPYGVRFSPNGEFIAASGGKSRVTQVWRTDSRKPVATFRAPEPDTLSVGFTFSVDSRRILQSIRCATPDGVWTGDKLATFDVETGTLESERALARPPVYLTALTNSRVAGTGASDSAHWVSVFSSAEGESAPRMPVPGLQATILRLDDDRFATGGTDGVVRVFSGSAIAADYTSSG